MKLTFREALRGYVAPSTDHAAGFAQGRLGGGALGFRALATIDDLDAFETDPTHPVALEGAVDYAPLGRDLPLRGGVLNLLVPGGGGRRLRYRIPFEAEGRRFEIVGEKRISRRSGFRDFTTLYVDLFEVHDASPAPEPLARGRLHVPLAEALRFPFGMRGPGRSGLAALVPVFRFLRFVRREIAAPLPILPS